jgi:predicted ATP-grasp superfamily ATP-dependent carboligase
MEHTRASDPEVRTARELAEHGADIRHLQLDMDKMVKDMDEIKESIREISKTLSEAKGGWRMFMMIGGVGATVGAAASWLFDVIKN